MDKALIERFRDLRASGCDKGRTVALLAVGIQGELGNHQCLAADVHQREVHLVIFIGEDAQIHDLLCQEAHFLLGILAGYAQQDHQTLTDLSDCFAADLHTGCGYPLYHSSHLNRLLLTDSRA